MNDQGTFHTHKLKCMEQDKCITEAQADFKKGKKKDLSNKAETDLMRDYEDLKVKTIKSLNSQQYY